MTSTSNHFVIMMFILEALENNTYRSHRLYFKDESNANHDLYILFLKFLHFINGKV